MARLAIDKDFLDDYSKLEKTVQAVRRTSPGHRRRRETEMGALVARVRCLLFVACTRARDHLYLSYSGSPSPFLK